MQIEVTQHDEETFSAWCSTGRWSAVLAFTLDETETLSGHGIYLRRGLIPCHFTWVKMPCFPAGYTIANPPLSSRIRRMIERQVRQAVHALAQSPELELAIAQRTIQDLARQQSDPKTRASACAALRMLRKHTGQSFARAKRDAYDDGFVKARNEVKYQSRYKLLQARSALLRQYASDHDPVRRAYLHGYVAGIDSLLRRRGARL